MDSMNDLIILVLVIIVGFVVYPKVIKPRLENKIKDMETEFQRRKQQR